jgi:glycerophosphoryl diester phosphodiesterase
MSAHAAGAGGGEGFRLWPWAPERPNRSPGLPPVIGHRGAAAAAPENTLASLRMASTLGATWVEFDVKLTADGVPILIHDDRLERTTDGLGRVSERTLAQIRVLDAGGWFAPAFIGERVPTLEEALALCLDLGLGINVEIKPSRGREVETARATIAALREHWPAQAPSPLISSFAHAALLVARDLAPGLPRGYLTDRVPRAWALELQRYGCATLHANQRWITAQRIRSLRAAGVPLLLYTVNDPERAGRLLRLGATSVFTDRVDEVLAAIGP